jgi:hypothetical protein
VYETCGHREVNVAEAWYLLGTGVGFEPWHANRQKISRAMELTKFAAWFGCCSGASRGQGEAKDFQLKQAPRKWIQPRPLARHQSLFTPSIRRPSPFRWAISSFSATKDLFMRTSKTDIHGILRGMSRLDG